MDRHVTCFGPLAMHGKVHHATSLLQVANLQADQLTTPQPVEEIGRQDGPIPEGLEAIAFGGGQQGTGLVVGEGRRFPFIVVFRHRPFDTIHRIVVSYRRQSFVLCGPTAVFVPAQMEQVNLLEDG